LPTRSWWFTATLHTTLRWFAFTCALRCIPHWTAWFYAHFPRYRAYQVRFRLPYLCRAFLRTTAVSPFISFHRHTSLNAATPAGFNTGHRFCYFHFPPTLLLVPFLDIHAFGPFCMVSPTAGSPICYQVPGRAVSPYFGCAPPSGQFTRLHAGRARTRPRTGTATAAHLHTTAWFRPHAWFRIRPVCYAMPHLDAVSAVSPVTRTFIPRYGFSRAFFADRVRTPPDDHRPAQLSPGHAFARFALDRCWTTGSAFACPLPVWFSAPVAPPHRAWTPPSLQFSHHGHWLLPGRTPMAHHTTTCLLFACTAAPILHCTRRIRAAFAVEPHRPARLPFRFDFAYCWFHAAPRFATVCRTHQLFHPLHATTYAAFS